MKLFILDASSYLFRAYYAIGHLSSSKGIPTNATYGFVQMFLRLLEEHKPTHLVAVWDRPEPTFRKQVFEAYKAQRKEMPSDLAEQIPWIKKILQAMNIPALEKAGFEADDIIGTITRRFENEGIQIVIVTGDKDLMQLVSDRVELLDTMKNRRTDIKGVHERFGVAPAQVTQVLGLSGDASDNIPGVPGIGEKTATSLIQQFGSIDSLYQRLDEVKGKKREILEKNKELALLSRQLVTIDCQVPIDFKLEDFKTSPNPLLCKEGAIPSAWQAEGEAQTSPLYEIFKELGFTRLLSQFVSDSSSSSEGAGAGEKIDTTKYLLVNTEENFQTLLKDLEQVPEFAFDTETTSLNPREAKLVGLSFCTEEGRAYYVPVGHVRPLPNPLLGKEREPGDHPLLTKEGAGGRSDPTQLDLRHVLHSLKPILENPLKLKVAQNFKFDYQVLKTHGVEVSPLSVDPMIASYLIDPTEGHGMDALAQKYLGHRTIRYEEVTDAGRKSFAEVPLDQALAYSGEDADVTFRLSKIFLQKIKEENLLGVFQKIEIPLVSVLADIELTGIRIDRAWLTYLQNDFSDRMKKSEIKIYELAGEEFNVNSTKQLGKILFEKLSLPVQRKTKTGYSTDVDVLTTLAKLHDLPREILAYRSLTKLKSTYVDALLAIADPKTDRVHTSFNQTVAETGRLSSSDPNLQNIPIRTEDGRKIRRAFIAPEGFQLLSADYSQIELRLLAHVSKDESLVKAFQNGEDVHRMTAATLFGIEPKEVTSEMRSVGKTLNFSVIYGQTPFGLSGQIGVSQAKAKEYIEQYFLKYPGVLKYREEVLKEAREKGEVRTLYGRRRKVPDILSKNMGARGFAERIAFNTVIQGTAADLIKLAMIEIDQKFKLQKIKSKMLLQVHDELVFEVCEDELELVKNLVRHEMENIASLSVPLQVDLSLGQNWGEK